MSAYFITGTGTGVGKTLVTAALAHQLRARGRCVDAVKPIVTGFDEGRTKESDPSVLIEALGEELSARTLDRVSPMRFRAPLAPVMAARAEGREFDFAALVGFSEAAARKASGSLLIEGVGGVMVPLGSGKTVLDWIAGLACPAILVAGSYLGTLSHTLTALEVLRQRGILVAGVVVSESEASPLPLTKPIAAIVEFCAEPVLALPRLIGRGPGRWRRT
ncbi:MAG: dethiobiotin synthase [Alphaproteobacteria bacterium]